MPRDGSGNYSKPFPNVVTNTTIESTVFNGNTADVEQDLNVPRPIVAGGTGANNATTARANLEAERTFQEVANFDSHVWEAGSFYAAPGATASPDGGHWVFGTSVFRNGAGFGVIEAYVFDGSTPPKCYLRKRESGSWSAWSEQLTSVTATDARYVNVTGDTVTGALTINGNIINNSNVPVTVIGTKQRLLFTNPTTTANAGSEVVFATGDLDTGRWAALTGDIKGNSAGAANGDISLATKALNADTALTRRLTARANGVVDVHSTATSSGPASGALVVAGGVGVGGALHIGSTTKIVNSGNQEIWFQHTGGTGFSQFHDSGAQALYFAKLTSSGWDGNLFAISRTGQVNVLTNIASTSSTTGALVVAGGIGCGGALFAGGRITSGTDIKTGNGVIRLSSDDSKYIYWTGSYCDINMATTFSAGTTSSNPTSGALVVAGGVGVGGALYTGGNVVVGSNAVANATLDISATTGTNPALRLLVGGAVQWNIYDVAGTGDLFVHDADASAGVKLGQNTSAWVAASDERLAYKRTARDITDDLPSLSDYRLYEHPEQRDVFSTAQIVARLFPQIVQRGDDDPDYVPQRIDDPRMWGMMYDRMGAIALAYLRQHQRRLDHIEQHLVS